MSLDVLVNIKYSVTTENSWPRLNTVDSHPPYLITFEGRSHQDHWPHGGNHVIWRDVLSLGGVTQTHIQSR